MEALLIETHQRSFSVAAGCSAAGLAAIRDRLCLALETAEPFDTARTALLPLVSAPGEATKGA